MDTLPNIAYEEARDELTDYFVYERLSRIARDEKLRRVFSELARTERDHYLFWKEYSKTKDIRPDMPKVWFVLLMQSIFGGSFVIKYLEKGEASVIRKYRSLAGLIPHNDRARFKRMIIDEERHEQAFAGQIDRGNVKYMSFIVLGLADAIVEIAGIHAGSLGIYNSTLITGLAGIVAGAAASIAMASAAYAQAKHGFKGSPVRAAAYTGVSYFISAVILATPYFLTSTMLTAIVVSVALGISIIAAVSWYNSIISDSGFGKDFVELSSIMLGATIVLFLFGTLIRGIFHLSL